MKVLSTREEVIETCYQIIIEHEGEEYTCNMYSSDKNSWIDWFDSKWRLITQPDWADDLDLWDLYNQNERESK